MRISQDEFHHLELPLGEGRRWYYTIVVDGQENPDAAWYYPDPKPAARNVKHHVAFWRGVEITK